MKNAVTLTAIAASPRKLMFAGLAGGLIALASAGYARAGEAVTDAENSASISVAAVPAMPPVVSREYLIKAAILFNFTKFAKWPAAAFEGADAPLRICVIGDDPFGPALDALRGKTVRERTLTASRIADVASAAQCHVLFVAASERARLPQILAAVGKLPILTVADMGRFTDLGGIIALKETDHRSRIEINLDAARRAGVTLSSKLLRLADNPNTSLRNDTHVGARADGAI